MRRFACLLATRGEARPRYHFLERAWLVRPESRFVETVPRSSAPVPAGLFMARGGEAYFN